jgi:hypothetical protein
LLVRKIVLFEAVAVTGELELPLNPEARLEAIDASVLPSP